MPNRRDRTLMNAARPSSYVPLMVIPLRRQSEGDAPRQPPSIGVARGASIARSVHTPFEVSDGHTMVEINGEESGSAFVRRDAHPENSRQARASRVQRPSRRNGGTSKARQDAGPQGPAPRPR